MTTATKPAKIGPAKKTEELYAEPAAQAQPAAQRPEEFPLVNQLLENTVREIDQVAAACVKQVEQAEGRLKKSVIMAQGIARLKALLTDKVMQEYFMPLQDSKLGFLTDRKDKEPRGYPVPVVRDCLIEALLKDFYPVNNEFNIIAGNFYGAQNGWYRKVCEIPGLTDLDVVPGTPYQHNGQTVVRVVGQWKYRGERQKLLAGDGGTGRTFTIRVNQGAGPDNIIGKALAKAYHAIYIKVTGTESTEADEEINEGLQQSRAAEIENKLTAQTGQRPASAPPKPKEEAGTVQAPQIQMLKELSKKANLSPGEFDGWLARYHVEKAEELSELKAAELIGALSVEAEAPSKDRQPGEDG